MNRIEISTLNLISIYIYWKVFNIFTDIQVFYIVVQ